MKENTDDREAARARLEAELRRIERGLKACGADAVLIGASVPHGSGALFALGGGGGGKSQAVMLVSLLDHLIGESPERAAEALTVAIGRFMSPLGVKVLRMALASQEQVQSSVRRAAARDGVEEKRDGV